MSVTSEIAYAKLNLALHVRERMADGNHRIETIFAFCEDGDELTAEESESISLAVQGQFGAGLESDDNLVVRAAEALQRHSGSDRGANLRLQKNLPVASGVGGGSADAAAALRLLNGLWGLDWPLDRLDEIGRELGADVPACIHSAPMRGQGRGDELEPVDLDLSGTPVLLVNPRVELSTAEVFGRWDGVDRGPLGDWRHGRNDLEPAAASMAPQIGSIIAWLSTQDGAHCVRMSGSGATCFALFETEAQRDHAAEGVPREWWRLTTRLR
ncbi:MAG TPA: 4-(cytidine 5'-diphospho)-2-C-methyl-D-erythritol kinase [Sphingomicrobium sp.]|nr:4-(cytidine 5'-diphospho)-2-C-methyl-D-erythritol kinase [Sphingomicrobium sp.]